MNSFGDFFSGLSDEASLIFTSLIIVGFLFGALVGYLLRSGAFSKLSAKAENLEMTANQKQVEMDQLRQNLNVAEKSKVELEKEIGQAKSDRSKMAGRLQPLEKELDETKTELGEAKSAIQGYLSTIDDLHDQVLGLKNQNERLTEEEQAPAREAELEMEEGDMAKAFSILSAQLRELQRSNKSIATDIQALKGPAKSAPEFSFAPAHQPESEPALPESGIPAEEHAIEESENPADMDDLTRIEGIGPFLQQKLYEANIKTFQQIANFSPQDVHAVTQKIGYIPGRIEKDDWVGQARELAPNDNE